MTATAQQKPTTAQQKPSGGSTSAQGLAIPELRLQSIAVSSAGVAQGKQASDASRKVQARVVPLEPDGRVATKVRFESFSVAAGSKPLAVRRVAAATGPDTHLSVALLLDVSGSMKGARIEAARKAIAQFLGKLQPADRAALVTFGKSATLKQDFTTDKGKVLRAVQQSQAKEDHTAVYDALELTTRIGWGATPGNRAVVLLTDGADNASRFKADDTVHLVEKRGVPVYTIALGNEANRATLARIATLSGGSAFVTDGARGGAALNALYLEAWKHLAGGYVVEFNAPADVRRVAITWKRPDGRNPSVDADLLHSETLAAPALAAASSNPPPPPPKKSDKGVALPLPLALGGAALVLFGALGAGLMARRNAQQRTPEGSAAHDTGQGVIGGQPLADLFRQSPTEQATVMQWVSDGKGGDIGDTMPTLVGVSEAGRGQGGGSVPGGGYRKGDTLVRPAPGVVTGVASAWLIVVGGPLKGRQFTLDSDEILVGRSAESQARLDADPDVSRSHAKIKATSTGYTLVDLASANGVFVNGQRVYQHTLQDNDRITLGQSELVFKALNLGNAAPVA